MVSLQWSWILLLYSLGPINGVVGGQSSPVTDCDRNRSRLARSIINEYLLPHMHWSSYKLPEQCPLHPVNDMFAAIEGAKEQVKAHQWQCGFCGTVSGSEELLDQHIHSKHSEAAHKGGDHCLADMCDVLHCDHIHDQILGPGAAKSTDPYARHAPCIPEKALQLKRSCREMADTCFPIEAGNRAPEMWVYFTSHICDAHTCNEEAKTRHLRTIVDNRPHIKWGFSIFAGFVTFALIGFYIIFWIYMHICVGVVSADEITSLQRKQRKSWWPFGKKKPKEL